MVHILDDFLLIETCQKSALTKFKSFIDMCADIGVPLSADKTVLPTQTIEFVGITLDVKLSEARLPLDKLQRCGDLLQKFLGLKCCILRDLQSLIGVLNFACSVIQPGRAFLRRLINLTMNMSKDMKLVYISNEAKDDMRTWLQFLQAFNGKSIFLDETFLSSNKLELYTDAAQSKGFAGIYKSQWFFGEFPDS